MSHKHDKKDKDHDGEDDLGEALEKIDHATAKKELEKEQMEDEQLFGTHQSYNLEDIMERMYEQSSSVEDEAAIRRMCWDRSSDANVSSADIGVCTRAMLGRQENYCTPTKKEVVDFRCLMHASYTLDQIEFNERFPNPKLHPSLLPRSVVPPPPKDLLSTLPKRVFVAEMKLSIPSNPAVNTTIRRCKIEVSLDETADSVLASLWGRFVKRGWVEEKDTQLNFIFKHPSQNEFFYGNTPMKYFDYIRRECEDQIQKNKRKERRSPVVRLVYAYNTFRDQAHNAVQMELKYRRLDVREPVLHDAITTRSDASTENVVDPAADSPHLSLWDIDQPFSLVINGISNIVLEEKMKKKHGLNVPNSDLLVCVFAEIYYGGRLLGDAMQTPWRLIKNANQNRPFQVTWGEPSGRLVFTGLRTSDIPREARLCLSIFAVNPDQLEASSQLAARDRNVVLAGMKSTFRIITTAATLVTSQLQKEDNPHFFLGWVNGLLFDHYGYMAEGEIELPIWMEDKRANPIAVSSNNSLEKTASVISLEFPRFPKPVYFPEGEPPHHKFKELEDFEKRNEEVITSNADLQRMVKEENGKTEIAHLKYIRALYEADPLYHMEAVDKVLLWKYRKKICKIPRALPRFLQAVDWSRPAAVYEVHCLLNGGEVRYYYLREREQRQAGRRGRDGGRDLPKYRYEAWTGMLPLAALELLDARFPDSKVREKAVEYLDKMHDWEMKDFVLQLVQVLKYETCHYSALARFLLRRAIASPFVIGQPFFWHLKAEMQDLKVCERHGLLLEEFVQRSFTRCALLRQHYVVGKLLSAAIAVKHVKEKEARVAELHAVLEKEEFPPYFTIPLDHRMEIQGIRIRKCKVMDSKKLPLWIVFINAVEEAGDLRVIFKAGDDLRQDLLTLQILGIMDRMWKSRQLDLRIRAYGCIATADGVGMIEVVDNSDTVANITRDYGGANAAFDKWPLLDWLKKENPDQVNCQFIKRGVGKSDIPDEEVPQFVHNFVASCAGYAPATYILGIGDRHNDNIMLTRRGCLFHIDFGHFLGNFKEKFGFKRETAPFVFTPMYAHVMGGKNSRQYKRFCKLACQAFNIVRDHAALLINLFNLMLSTGIPELQKSDDIEWLKTVLLLPKNILDHKMDDKESEAEFCKTIEQSLNNKKAVFNDYVHIMAH